MKAAASAPRTSRLPPAAIPDRATAARTAPSGAQGLRLLAAVSLLTLAAACSRPDDRAYQGYVEGEYVYAGATIAGRLDVLAVRRGDDVVAGAPLFTLESAHEAAQRAQADAQLKGAQATLADLKSGKRVPEVNVSRAQLAEARVAERKSSLQAARDEAQYRIGGISRAALDDSRALHDADAARVRQIENEVTVATLPNRDEQIRAQGAQVAAAQAVVDQAAWRQRQTRVEAGRAAHVEDTLYQKGEYVAAGMPVVKLLPPDNVKLRFFVPQAALAKLRAGTRLTARCDGCGADIGATVTFIASRAEYTPPVIYSNDTRGKLVFMVEAHPDGDAAAGLHPGQPIVVTLP